MSSLAHGHGIATLSGDTVLDVWFPTPALGALTGSPTAELQALATPDTDRAITREVISIEIDLSQSTAIA